MALSMDEQRILAEIERRLADEDPGLAARLSSFRRPGPTMALRSPRVRIFGSVLTVALVAVVSLMVYAMIPLRSHSTRLLPGGRQATPTNEVMTQPNASSGTGGKPAGTAGTSATASGATTTSISPQGTSTGRQSAPAKTQNVRASKSATTPAVAHWP